MPAGTEPVGLFAGVGSLQQGVASSAAQAVNMPAPTSLMTILTGATAAVATIDLPWPNFTGRIVYISTSATPFTLVATGAAGTPNALSRPIAVAATAVRYRAMELYCDGALWYPSYV